MVTAQDRFLPRFDVRERHELLVRASPEEAYVAFRRVDFSRSRLVRVIFGLRTLPSWLRRRPWGAPRGPFLEQALGMGWVVLDELPGRELVAGAVTRPWEAEVTFTGIPAEGFAAFEEPGFVKIVWGFSAREEGEGRALLATETRVQATDLASRARFRRYWLLVGTGIRLIRWVALRMV